MIMVITMIMAMTIMKKLLQYKWWLQLQLMDDDSDNINGSDISHANNDDEWWWLELGLMVYSSDGQWGQWRYSCCDWWSDGNKEGAMMDDSNENDNSNYGGCQ